MSVASEFRFTIAFKLEHLYGETYGVDTYINGKCVYSCGFHGTQEEFDLWAREHMIFILSLAVFIGP